MDIKELILKHLKKHQKVKITQLVKKTGFSRAYLHRFFRELQDEGKIILVGRTNQAHYILSGPKSIRTGKSLSFRRTLLNKNLFEDTVLRAIKRETAIFDGLRKNVADILDYAFTEMLNNAIEHSKSKKILVQMEKADKLIKFRVTDWGVGVFNDIKRKFRLKDIFEAMELLLKGKQTTVPETHTGEGIFFTSKVGDKFALESSNKKLIFDNKIDDVFVRDSKKTKGTRAVFEILTNSQRELSSTFEEYTSENFVFDKTKVIVKLFELGGQSYISRSQARRLLFGLEKFQRVVLDFKKVETIGQAFADEVFRVWQKKHRRIKIESINCGQNIKFMIKRALRSIPSTTEHLKR